MDVIYLKTPIGTLKIEGDTEGVSGITFVEIPAQDATSINANTQVAVDELKEYFFQNRKSFTFLLHPKGTQFQQKVWNQLQTIPHGKTISYQQIANQLGDPKVIRAAASANGKNPLAIVIPCHRVIGSDGSLTGYAGGLHRKKWLLAHESPVKQGTLF